MRIDVKGRLKGAVLLFILILAADPCLPAESTQPPNPLNSVSLGLRVLKKTLKNSHYKVIGECTWLTKDVPPKTKASLAVEQFLPDLVITVSNNPGENPWKEARVFESSLAMKVYQKTYKALTGFNFDYGNDTARQNGGVLFDDRSRVVHVIGSPAAFYNFPQVSHKAETRFGVPYYSSHADATLDRTESAELVYMATHPNLLVGHEIGSSLQSWGPEIPRLMRVTQPSRFRASVVAAMHAADIVTNTGMHVRHETTNSCGSNCVVANVVHDPSQKQVIWQEVYPKNRNVIPGDATDFGEADDAAGNGNYVFVVWRKYRGCVKQRGKLLYGFPRVGKPQKR